MIPDNKKLDVFHQMAYFASLKKYAIQQILKLEIPLTSNKETLMNIMYGTYFIYLVALIDFLQEKKLLSCEEIIEFLKSKNNLLYIRNLRNSIVHRGLEVSSAGATLKNHPKLVVPLAPKEVVDKHGKNKYFSFTSNLLQTVIICEQVNHFCLQIIEKNNLAEYPDDTEEEFKNRHKNDSFILDCFKTEEYLDLIWKSYQSQVADLHKNNVQKFLSYFYTKNLF